MKFRTLSTALLLGASALGFSQALITSNGYGNVQPYVYNGATHKITVGKGVFLTLPSPNSLLKMDLPAGTNWTGYTHLQISVQNTGTTPEPFLFCIQSTGIWCFAEVVLMPGSQGKILMPMDNSPVLGQYRWAQPPNTTYNQVFGGYTVDRPNVKWLMVHAPNQSAGTSLLINDMRPVTTPVPTSSIVDKYGQQAQVTWRSKIINDGDLANALASRPISGNYPFSSDIYGGVNGTSQAGSATGRWHTAKQNGKWYIIDPLGNRFFSAGVVMAGNATPGIISGRENLFAAGALPSQSGPFAEHYQSRLDPFGNRYLTFNFYTANVQRRVGTSWRQSLISTTSSRMRTWGFNTAGASSYLGVEGAATQISSSEIVLIGGSYAKVWDPSLMREMPDVFDPAWAQALSTTLAPKVSELSGNLFNMGMFVDNELPWAKVYSTANARYGLAEDILISPATQPAKINFVNWLKQRYSNNLLAFNQSWGSSFGSFDALLTSFAPVPAVVPSGMARDMQDFTLLFARTYFSTVKQKLNQLGYQGLYLGARFLYYSPESLQAAKEYCDVVTFNGYEDKPTNHHEELKALDAPVFISEIGAGACDMGRTPSNPNLLTEGDRAAYMKRYMADALTWQNLVGVHWYKWEDDVISGRFYDGDNCGVGLVSVTDVPYWATVDTLTAANTAFHQRLLNP